MVCFDTPAEQLLALFSSLAISLAELSNQFSGVNCEIAVIDNATEPLTGIRETVANSELGDPDKYRVRLISGHGNIGYARGHNLAIRKLDSDYHLILNPDVILDRNALVQGIAYLEANHNAVLLSPHSADENGNRQYLCKRYPSVFLFLLRGFAPGFIRKIFAGPLARFEMRELSGSEPTNKIPIVSGCFMLCRTDALKSIAGFDPGYFLYFEDFDLSLRMGEIGDIVYLPAMKIVHHGGNSARKGWKHIGMFLRSGIRFFNGHGWRIF